MSLPKVLFITATAAERQYLLESLKSLGSILPYAYKVVNASEGKANAAADASLELSSDDYTLVVAAGYARTFNTSFVPGALITPATVIDIDLGLHSRIRPDADIQYQFDLSTPGAAGLLLSSDRWVCHGDVFCDLYSLVGAEKLQHAAVDTNSAALAQVAEDVGVPFAVAKFLVASISMSTEVDVEHFTTAGGWLRNFDCIAHYTTDVLAKMK